MRERISDERADGNIDPGDAAFTLQVNERNAVVPSQRRIGEQRGQASQPVAVRWNIAKLVANDGSDDFDIVEEENLDFLGVDTSEI